METLEQNKLIAEFMGIIKEDDSCVGGKACEFEPGRFVSLQSMGKGFLKYDTEWNWLMPVVRRIVDVCHADLLEDDSTLFESEYYDSILDTIPCADIESSYKVVTEFIKWYNKQP